MFQKVLFLFVLMLNPVITGASTIYSTLIQDASDLTSVLVTIDVNTGVVTELGSMGVNIQSLAYDSTYDVLYGAGVNPLNVSENFQLYTIDRHTGAVTLVGDMGWQFATAMTYNHQLDTLFAQVGGFFNYLTTVDRQSGVVTQIDAGVLGISTSSIEYIPGTEQLAFVSVAGQYGYYNTIDGSFDISGTGGLSGVGALAYDSSIDQLLGLSNSGLYTIDITNGIATQLTDISTGFYGSMAIIPVPIPGALLFLLSAVGVFAPGIRARSNI